MDSSGRIHELALRLNEETAIEAAQRRKRELEALARRVEADGVGPLIPIPAGEVEQLRKATPEERRAWHAKKLVAKAARKRQREARRRQR